MAHKLLSDSKSSLYVDWYIHSICTQIRNFASDFLILYYAKNYNNALQGYGYTVSNMGVADTCERYGL